MLQAKTAEGATVAQTPQSLVERVYEAINAGDPTVFDLLDTEIEWVTPRSLPWTLPGSHQHVRRPSMGRLATTHAAPRRCLGS